MQFPNRRLILGIITSTLFVIIIDVTVLYTALPAIVQSLSATASEKLWIINAYPLVVAGLLPAAGMLSDRLGHKRLFIAGLPVFALASACAAFSPSAGILIACRVFLAIGAAMMMPATLAIVRYVFTNERERALAIGIWAAVASSAAALGPLMGGVLLNYFWWGSVFLINVPIVLLVLPFAWSLIPDQAGDLRRPFDIIGSLQIMLGLVGVIFALKELSKLGGSISVVIMASIVGIGFLLLFVRRQQRARQPMIDFSLFRNGYFASGVLVAIISMIALNGIELVLSQRLQLVSGFTPLMAGLFMLPIPIASALGAALAGMLIPRSGERLMILAGFTLAAIGILGQAALYQSTGLGQLVCLLIIGLGLGISFTAASTAIMLHTPEEKAGMVAAIEDVSWEMGSVLGITLLGGLMNAIYSNSLMLPAGLAAHERAWDSIDEALQIARSLNLTEGELLTNLARAAFDDAFKVVYISAALLMLLSLGLLTRLLSKPAPQ